MSTSSLGYLRVDKLLPGDVLLSLAAGKESAWIARSTFGRFSHAAIYLGNLLLFESIDDGVGFTALKPAKACSNPGGGKIVLVDISNYRRLEVWRHPHVRKLCDSSRYDVEDRLIEYLVPTNGKEYPPFPTLAKAVPYVPTCIAYAFLWVIARYQKELIKSVPGMFCSQLVATALGKLDAYPLRNDWLRRRIPPANISPNRLCSRLTELKPVPDVVVDLTFNCPEQDDDRNQRHLTDLKDILGQTERMTNKCEAQKRLKAIRKLDEKLEEIKQELERKSKELQNR